MGINFRKRVPLSETILMDCENCQKVFPADSKFCPTCGQKLISRKSTFYANLGKNGITSFSYKMANGITINSKNVMTIPLAKGISYTTTMKK